MSSLRRPPTISKRLYSVRNSQGAEDLNATPYDFDKTFKKHQGVKKRNISSFI